MIDNKDMPAFPTITWEQLNNGQFVQVTEYSGVSKFEFFACNAPDNIPGWFVHESPDLKVTPQPQWHTLPKNDQEHIKNWHADGLALPEHLKWFGELYLKHEEEDRAFRSADWAARYFQWRRYYAEQLLTTLSKPQP